LHSYQVLRLTEKNQEFQKELASVQAVLGRMKMVKQALAASTSDVNK
jgi:hypothetical protein